MMTLNEIKAGMQVITRDNKIYIVEPTDSGYMLRANSGSWNRLGEYENDLKCRGAAACDIMKVYSKLRNPGGCVYVEGHNRTLLWERKENYEMTLEEIEKELGRPITIVNEK